MLKNTLMVLALVLVAGAGLLPFSGEPRNGEAVAAEPAAAQPADIATPDLVAAQP